ncbi:MAG: class I SAM-dependent methyltransferase [Thaumarchaeota archaeon]|nr:class I SAM-dependent methyltransferase [Nitrososphaerota archaeon]
MILPVLLALLVAVVFVCVSFVLPALTGAPWVPSSNDIVRKMLVLSKVKPGEEVYDLGSGDGRIVIMSAKEFGARSTGIEIDVFRAFYSKLLIRLLGLAGKARVIWSSFYRVDLSRADVVTVYLLPETNDKLTPKLERELRPTCRVVSHAFKFDWQLLDSDEGAKIYVYNPRPSAPLHGALPGVQDKQSEPHRG